MNTPKYESKTSSITPALERETQRLHERLSQGMNAFTSGPLDNVAEIYDARSVMQETGRCLYQHDYESDVLMPQMVQMAHDFYHKSLRPHLKNKHVDVLDIDCADGERTLKFLEGLDDYVDSYSVIGGDISPGMVEVAKRRLGKAFVMDIRDLPYSKDFALINSLYSVIGHLKESDIPLAFAQVYKALESGGFACIDVLAKTEETRREFTHTEEDENLGRNYMTYYVFDRKGKPLMNTGGQPYIGTNKWFTQEELRDLALEAGFDIIKAESVRCKGKVKTNAPLFWMEFYIENAMVLKKPIKNG